MSDCVNVCGGCSAGWHGCGGPSTYSVFSDSERPRFESVPLETPQGPGEMPDPLVGQAEALSAAMLRYNHENFPWR